MFTTKKTSLFEVKKKTSSDSNNKFISEALKESATTLSGNGSLKYSTTGSDFLDQFGSVSNYRKLRSFEEISKDMNLIYSQDKEKAIALILYIRLITRNVTFFDGSKSEKVQKGQGLRHEAILRMLWIAINDEQNFWNNIHLFISAGSWKDIITMMSYDVQYHGWDNHKLNWDIFAKLIMAGLENPNTSDLVKKYLPQIKAKSKCVTLEAQADNIIAKYICYKIFGEKDEKYRNYKQYRKLKTSGNAHEWQKLISKKLMSDIDFNTIHGRALSLLVSGKFLANNGLESKYEKWIKEQPVAKFTGYVYELFKNVYNLKPYQIHTINKQFEGLTELARKDGQTKSSFLVVRDTSSSMGAKVEGLGISAHNFARSVALYFSYIMDGYFKDYYVEFNSTAKMVQWKGKTPYEKYKNDTNSYIGSTNITSVASLFVELLRKGVHLEDFPSGIICISDGEFNRNGSKTATEEFINILVKGGFPQEYILNFKIVLWDVASGYYLFNGEKRETKFETFGNSANFYYIGGYDPSIASFIFGTEVDEKNGSTVTPKSADELMELALSQEIMQKIKIS